MGYYVSCYVRGYGQFDHCCKLRHIFTNVVSYVAV